MSKHLTEALADLKELIGDATQISHPYTDAHVNETRRKAFRIGASLVGEERSRYLAVLEVGMKTIAAVQTRNSKEILQENSFVGVAGVQSDTLRWEDRLESLEYAMASFGLESTRDGDDGLVVSPVVTAGQEALYTRLPSSITIKLLDAEKHNAIKATASTFLSNRIAQGTASLDRDEAFLFLQLLDEANASCKELRRNILRDNKLSEFV